jgi:hypothetical protein
MLSGNTEKALFPRALGWGLSGATVCSWGTPRRARLIVSKATPVVDMLLDFNSLPRINW